MNRLLLSGVSAKGTLTIRRNGKGILNAIRNMEIKKAFRLETKDLLDVLTLD
jgi:hypothetical protein